MIEQEAYQATLEGYRAAVELNAILQISDETLAEYAEDLRRAKIERDAAYFRHEMRNL